MLSPFLSLSLSLFLYSTHSSQSQWEVEQAQAALTIWVANKTKSFLSPLLETFIPWSLYRSDVLKLPDDLQFNGLYKK